MMHYFCTTRDAALTVSSADEENHYWQAVMANCEMEIKPLVITAPTRSCAHRYTGERSKTAMITDKRANNISPLSLAGRLNSNCYERHAWWTENHFECLQILLPLKLKALVQQWGKAPLWNQFFFCFFFLFSRNEPHKSAPQSAIYHMLCAGWKYRTPLEKKKKNYRKKERKNVPVVEGWLLGLC